MRRAWIPALMALCSLVGAAAQVRDAARPIPPTGTAQIAGTLVTGAADAPVPVRRAIVTLTGDQHATRLVAVTDDAGSFVFTSLPADRYAVTASKAGFVAMAYGSKRPGGTGTPILLAADGRASISLTLPRGSVLTGTVRDEFGRPAPGVTMTALRYAVSPRTGERAPQSARIGSAGQLISGYAPDAFPGTAVTDDRGVYRIYGLAAGDYLVSASARSPMGSPVAVTDVHQITDADVQRAQQQLRAPGVGPGGDSPATTNTGPAVAMRVDYAPVYHPAAIARDEAATITLGEAEERSGIDVLLRMVPTASIYGTLTAPDGSPVPGAQVAVMDPLQSSFGRVLKTSRSNEDGEFVISSVPPGRYLVQSSGYPSGLIGSGEVVVAGRDVPLSLLMGPGVTVSGRIVFDGSAKPPDVSAVRLFLARTPYPVFDGFGFEMSPDGRFVFSRIAPGTYTLRLNGRAPAGWALRSASIDGADRSDVGFEVKPNQHIEGVVVTLTDRTAEISGTLQAASGAPAPGYTLVVFSADARFWVAGSRRTQHVRPDVEGRYVARDLPAGDYLIAVVTDLEDGQWHDRTFLAELAASSPLKITVAEGDRKVQDIRISASQW